MHTKIVNRCPECWSSQRYYRKRNNTFLCRTCGYEWQKPEPPKEQNKGSGNRPRGEMLSLTVSRCSR